ncbi:hypothetical protein KIN20_028602 [Parelaphostrongylus tenuis]|uniref:Uncharacterized protein n=1 Tax=Parelaphostrongylus tenuis TaxID=148309 RepID=A0AAD5R111_PARTN|nr:hypothetical protein KIN20_028602 [Parelaphostrongylus tenuis]
MEFFSSSSHSTQLGGNDAVVVMTHDLNEMIFIFDAIVLFTQYGGRFPWSSWCGFRRLLVEKN